LKKKTTIILSAVAFFCTILLPVAGYWIVKVYSKDAVKMPLNYSYYKDEKKFVVTAAQSDTPARSVRNIKLTNQLGKSVSLDDLKGKILVIDFFFSHCPSICPGMAKSMKRLQKSFEQNPDIVQFLTISIDPKRDSVPQLRKFANRLDIDHDTWWFLTGDKNDIYDFALNELGANIADAEVDTAFIHTENIFLIDTNRVLRGWYNAFDTVKQSQLVRDIPTVMLQKDKKSPSIFREFIPYLPVIFIGIALTILTVSLLSVFKNKKNDYTLTKKE
jgi:protein SCO1/2